MRTYISHLEQMLVALEKACQKNKECLADRNIKVRRKNRDTKIYHVDKVSVEER